MQLSKIHIHLKESSYKKDYPLLAVLFISKQYIHCCIKSEYNNAIVFFKMYEANCVDAQLALQVEQDLKSFRINKTIIGLADKRFTLLPRIVLDDSLSILSLKYAFDLTSEDEIFKQALAWQEMYGVHAVKSNTIKLFNQIGQNIYFANAYISLLSAYANYLHVYDGNVVFVFVESDAITVTGYINSKLKVHQVFEYDTLDTAHYYLEKCIQQVGLGVTKLAVHGEEALEFKKHNSNYYLIDILPLQKGFEYTSDLNKDLSHEIFTLISIAKYANN
jgi:hypothetical protein